MAHFNLISRRRFLSGVAASALMLSAERPAQAWFHGSALSVFNGGKSQVNFDFMQNRGDYPFLNHLKTAQAWVPGNNASTPVTPDMLDANGYPTTFTNSIGVATAGVYTVFSVPSQAERPGNYVVTWTGNGTIFVGMSNTLVSGSKTGSGGSGRYVFSTTTGAFSIGITTLPVTDIKVFHVNDEPDIVAGKVFGTKFKQRLIEGGFGVLRFLNWQLGNTTNVTTWATRKPTSYVFYHGYELRNALFATSTATRTGTVYSAFAPAGFALADKAMVHVIFASSFNGTSVTFTNGSATIGMTAHSLSVNARIAFSKDPNNASTIPTNFAGGTTYYVVSVPDADHITVSTTQGGTAILAGSAQVGLLYGDPLITMNIGGTGDLDILSENSGYLSFGGNFYPVAGNFQSMATLVYDATLNKWIKYGGDAGFNSVGLDNGCPPELMVQLCAEIGAHPHFITPPLAIDPATDYMPSLAAYCRANGPSWMIPRFEGPNELWNGQSGFYQTGYANAKANAYKAADPTHWTVTADYHNWYGKVMSVLGQAISTVYAADRTKYQVLCGVQTGFGDTTGDAATSNPRLSSAAYISQTAAAQSPLSGSWGTITFSKTAGVADAKLWVTHVCCAQYFTPSAYGTGAETTLATAYNGGDLTAPATYMDTVNSGTGAFTISKCATLFANWKTWAQGFGVQKMCGYEGGYSPDYAGTAQVKALQAASKLVTSSPGSATGLQGYLYGNSPSIYGSFVGLTDGTFTAEFPSCFTFSGQSPSTNTWSVLEDIYQTPNPPQWNAIIAFNH